MPNSLTACRPDHASGPNKKVQLISKTPLPTAKPLKTNVFEDDARARREKRFEREALIERNRQMGPKNTHYFPKGANATTGSLGLRIQGFQYRSEESEPTPDVVRIYFAPLCMLRH
jgi:hypothetical protein